MIKRAAKTMLRRMIAKMEDDVDIRTEAMIDVYGPKYTMDQENQVIQEVEVLKDVITYLLTDLPLSMQAGMQELKNFEQEGERHHG